MFNAIILDDEKPALDILRFMLEKTGQICVVGSFTNAADALAGIQNLKPDVAFLDIEMSDMSGLELAGRFPDMGIDVEVVFVTAYDKYAIEAFRVSAIDYILKPFSLGDIEKSVAKLKKVKPIPDDSQAYSDKGRIYCFGGLLLYGAGCKEAVKWRTSKTEELFAIMLLNLGNKVAKWKIAQVLWPECDTEKQINTRLYTTVYNLKQTLLTANLKYDFAYANGCYRMELPEVYIDAAEFEAITDSGVEISSTSMERYKKAFGLYKGNYLEGNGYLWSQSKSEEYIKRYCNLVSEFAKYHTIRKEYADAERMLREALSIAPLDEELNETLLRLFYTEKDKASLVVHYKKVKELYESELGIVPKSAMRELFNRSFEL